MQTVISDKGGPSCVPSGKKGKCNSKPSEIPLGDLVNALSCAPKGKKFNEGNYILYTVGKDKTHSFLTLTNVDTEICIPKPKQCHCNTMLDKVLKKVLEQFPGVNRIDGYFSASHFMKGCRCYLGAAARAGFKFIESSRGEFSGRIEFTKNDYVIVCDSLIENGFEEGPAKLYKK